MWLNLEVNEQGVHPIGEEERALFAFHKCGFGEVAFRFGGGCGFRFRKACCARRVSEGNIV